ncbi:MAG: efflux RND transporter periplasmic adaptor subunit [Alphaproteobacteria bacterium]
MRLTLPRILPIACVAAAVTLAPPTSSPVAQSSDASQKKAGEPAKGGNPAAGKPGGKPEGGAQRGGGRPTFVQVDDVVRREMIETVPIYGRVVARQAGVVAARVRGGVAEIRADVGMRVRKGDVIAVLLTDMLKSERALKDAEIAEFKAKIHTAEAQVRLAEQELKRIERLRNSSAFSPARDEDKRREVERFRSLVAETTARVTQAEVERNMADINLTNATIRAPYDGVITQRHTEIGAFVNVSDKVVTMTNDTALEIEADVPSIHIAGLREGITVSVEPETAAPFDAVVRAVVPEENQLTRTRLVRFVPKPGSAMPALAANQSIRIHIPTGPPRLVTTAHKDALLHRRGATVMFVYADGKVARREVTIGQAFGNRFEIVNGLEPGEKVVTRGNERLRPNQEVQVRGEGKRGHGGRKGGGKSADAGPAPDKRPSRTE